MNNGKCLTFVTNNIKGIRNDSKRLSVVEYFRNKLVNNGILFLQVILRGYKMTQSDYLS